MKKQPSKASEALKDLLRGTRPQTEKVKKEDEISKPKKKNGGARPGSGRKPKEANLIERGIYAYMDDHYKGQVMITVTDPKTGETREIEVPRVVAALQKLYEIGTKGEGNSDALNKWLNRAVGMPMQPIEHRGDKDKPLHLILDV